MTEDVIRADTRCGRNMRRERVPCQPYLPSARSVPTLPALLSAPNPPAEAGTRFKAWDLVNASSRFSLSGSRDTSRCAAGGAAGAWRELGHPRRHRPERAGPSVRVTEARGARKRQQQTKGVQRGQNGELQQCLGILGSGHAWDGSFEDDLARGSC